MGQLVIFYHVCVCKCVCYFSYWSGLCGQLFPVPVLACIADTAYITSKNDMCILCRHNS